MSNDTRGAATRLAFLGAQREGGDLALDVVLLLAVPFTSAAEIDEERRCVTAFFAHDDAKAVTLLLESAEDELLSLGSEILEGEGTCTTTALKRATA